MTGLEDRGRWRVEALATDHLRTGARGGKTNKRREEVKMQKDNVMKKQVEVGVGG